MSDDKGRLGKAKQLAAVLAPAVGVVAYVFRREAGVAIQFVGYEVRSHGAAIAGLLGVAALLAGLPAAVRLVGWLTPPLGHYFKHDRSLRIAVVVAALAPLYPFLTCLRLEYRSFSEVSFPEAALRDLEEASFEEAVRRCKEYTALFPQRGPEGANADPVCTPVLRVGVGLDRLAAYFGTRAIAPSYLEGVKFPDAGDMRKRTLRIVHEVRSEKRRVHEADDEDRPRRKHRRISGDTPADEE